MCSKFGVLMFEVFDVRYFGVRSKTTAGPWGPFGFVDT